MTQAGAPSSQKSGGTLVKFLVAGLVTAASLALLAAFTDLEETGVVLGAIAPAFWVAGVVVMLAISIVRYIRLGVAVPKMGRRDVFRAAAFHGAAVAVLPGKIGEAALPIALKRAGGASLVSGAALLVLMRGFDIIALAAVTAVAYAFGLAPSREIAAALIVAALVGAALAPPVTRFLIQILSTRIRQLRPLLEAVEALSLARLYGVFALTLVIWAAIALTSAISFRAAFGFSDFADASVAVGAASLAFASPVNGLASAGPFEGAYAGALAALGRETAPALAAGAHVHICAIVAALATAAIGAFLAPQGALQKPSGSHA